MPDVNTTYYLNVNVALTSSSNEGSKWVIQNLPLFAVDDVDGDGSVRSEGVYFNLAEFNIPKGFDVTELYYSASVASFPQTSYSEPVGNSLVQVKTLVRHQSAGLEEAPTKDEIFNPGEPAAVTVKAAVTKANTGRIMNGVQEGENKCAAGAFARSLDWLNRKCHIGWEATAQQIYEDLIARKVSEPGQGGPNSRDEWILYKNTYAKEKSKDRIVTKVWKRSENSVDATPGVAQEGGDFLKWLMTEIPECDVEMAYFFPGNAHIVTLLEVFKDGDDFYAKYRDDEKQGDDATGDGKGGDMYPAVKTRKLYKTGDDYYFGSISNTVYFAVSECCLQVPNATPSESPSLTVIPSTTSSRSEKPAAPFESPQPTPGAPNTVPTSPAPTPADSRPDGGGFDPSECIHPRCCEEDCCGVGTSYSFVSRLCEPDVGASGWNGQHSTSYVNDCIRRSCCEGDCCSDRTLWDDATAYCIS